MYLKLLKSSFFFYGPLAANMVSDGSILSMINNTLQTESLSNPDKILLPQLDLNLCPLCYLGPLVQLGDGGGVKLPPFVFSRSTSPIQFKLGKYLTHHKYF